MFARDGRRHEPARLARQSFLAVSGTVDRASLPVAETAEMSTPLDRTNLLEALLKEVDTHQNHLPDSFDEVESLPARLRGLLAGLRQKNTEITRTFAQKRGVAIQQCISAGSGNSTVYAAKLRELRRLEEAHRSQLREEWYRELSAENKTAFDQHCMAMAEPILQPWFPQTFSGSLRGPLARLVLEYAAICRRFSVAREETMRFGIGRGQNSTGLESLLDGVSHDGKETKSNLNGRWLRELTDEQAAALDKALLTQGGPSSEPDPDRIPGEARDATENGIPEAKKPKRKKRRGPLPNWLTDRTRTHPHNSADIAARTRTCTSGRIARVSINSLARY